MSHREVQSRDLPVLPKVESVPLQLSLYSAPRPALEDRVGAKGEAFQRCSNLHRVVNVVLSKLFQTLPAHLNVKMGRTDYGCILVLKREWVSAYALLAGIRAEPMAKEVDDPLERALGEVANISVCVDGVVQVDGRVVLVQQGEVRTRADGEVQDVVEIEPA